MRRSFLILGFLILFSGICFAQTVNNETRIIGTWSTHDGKTWVFNNNGTMTMDGESHRFGVTGSKIALYFSNVLLIIFDYSISSDGRTLVLEGTILDGRNSEKWDVWLTRR